MSAWPTYHVIICIVKMATASTADSSSSPQKMRLKDFYNVRSSDTTLQKWLSQNKVGCDASQYANVSLHPHTKTRLRCEGLGFRF